MAPSRGVNVPIGEVSVIPQPSKILQPMTLSHRSLHRDRERRAARRA